MRTPAGHGGASGLPLSRPRASSSRPLPSAPPTAHRDEDIIPTDASREGRVALLAGASGLVGRELPARMLADPNCAVQWRNPPTLASLGCATFVTNLASVFTSGRLTDGSFRQGTRLSPKPIRRFGVAISRWKIAHPINMTPSALPRGFPAPTGTTVLPHA